MQGVPTASLYRLTTHTLKGMENKEINKRISLTMISYAASGIVTARVLQKLLDKGNPRNYVYFLNTTYIITAVYLLYIYHYPEYYLIFPVS